MQHSITRHSTSGRACRMMVWQVVLALMVGATAGTVVAAGSFAVAQRNRAFDRRSVSIVRGDTLRFANEDEFVHHIYVETASMTFDSKEQGPGTAVDVRFPAGGRFDVRCRIHPRMVLTVDVQ